ncbi:MAG TPA: L-aspartate oxidase [Immundisolibacter sp.]
MVSNTQVLIIGGGAAGLSLALRLANHVPVCILAKGPLTEGSSLYAQGGVAAVLGDQDSVESHVADTLVAGAGLCDETAVRFTVERSRAAIAWLIDQGVAFTRLTEPGGNGPFDDYHLTREGGHGQRRIIHAADSTGRAITTTLEDKVRAHPNITLHDHHIAIDLITTARLGRGHNRCLGAYVLDRRSGKVKVFRGRAVVLATGGTGKVYLYTSNPDVATGDGIAMAWRAGCRVGNMEFIQFHPTCLYHPKAKNFLISEALRGEGGRLCLPGGERFMHRYDDRLELAPRDGVARAIDSEMKRLGLECVYLDISHQPAEFIHEHFPTIAARCLELGIDITREPIPVVPAAHYLCGGVVTDLAGRTDVAGLYTVGEAAYTGLHGANRLASNSLLECLVFAESAAADILASSGGAPDIAIPPWDESQVTDSDEEVVVAHNWQELRRAMWDYVGIVRTDKRLARALSRVQLLAREIHEYYANFRVSNDLIELRNLVLVAELIVRSAQQRRESRGLHYSLDCPLPNAAQPPRPTLLSPPDAG